MTVYFTDASRKCKWIALLWCSLGFLGIAGLHYFYAGRWLMGLIYLLTGGLFGIGTVIDAIRILAGGFEDSEGAPLRH